MENIFSTRKKQILIFFCESYNYELYSIRSESGRESQLQASTYCIPGLVNRQPRCGSRMHVAPGDEFSSLKQCLGKHLKESIYNMIFYIERGGKDADVPLLLNEAGEVVSFVRFINGKVVFLFPGIQNKKRFLLELFEKILPDIPDYACMFPEHGSFKWVKDFSYISREERDKAIDIEGEIKRHNETLLSLNIEYEKIHNEEKNVKLRNILKETGDDLVFSVKWFLEYIGFADVVDPDKNVDVDAGEVFEEDLNFESNGINFLLEVKGIGGTSTDAQCAQISKIALRRKKSNPGNIYQAVYIVNHQRYQAPKDRLEVPFNLNQIEDAEISSRGMTFTYELFNIYHMIEAGVISKTDAREAFKQVGLINFRHSLHRLDFNHCYRGSIVYSLIIPEGSAFSLTKADKIAIQDNECHWHLLNIECIQVDREDVDEVSTGTVGIKVDRLISEAKAFYVVKNKITE